MYTLWGIVNDYIALHKIIFALQYDRSEWRRPRRARRRQTISPEKIVILLMGTSKNTHHSTVIG
jgi:hypothetical protein